MDRRERLDSPVETMQALLQGFRSDVWTALPGVLQSFDPAVVTAVVQPAIQAQLRSPAGVWTNATLPLCLDCPVVFPSGGGFSLTFPLAAGDEGLLVFASRCIDAWWQSGGVQPQAELRMHDLSDGFFLPGAYSKARTPLAVDTSHVQLRHDDGTVLIELSAGGAVHVVAPGGVTIDGDVQVNGSIVVSGEVTAGSIGLRTHRHSGVEPGGGDTNGPIP